MVGCRDRVVILSSSAPHKRLRCSEFSRRIRSVVVPHLLSPPFLHTNGSRIVAERSDGHAVAIAHGVFLWRDRIRGDIESVQMAR